MKNLLPKLGQEQILLFSPNFPDRIWGSRVFIGAVTKQWTCRILFYPSFTLRKGLWSCTVYFILIALHLVATFSPVWQKSLKYCSCSIFEVIKSYSQIKKGNPTEEKEVYNVNLGRVLGIRKSKPAGCRNLGFSPATQGFLEYLGWGWVCKAEYLWACTGLQSRNVAEFCSYQL